MIDLGFDFPWRLLERANTLGALVTTVASVCTLYAVTLGRKARHQRWFMQALAAKAPQEAILLVDLRPDVDIRAQVERARRDMPNLIPQSVDLMCLSRATAISVQDIPDLVRELRRKIADVVAMGAGSVLLIYAGPVQFASIVGYELRTMPNVRLLHYDKGTYVDWGPLQHPAD